MKYQSPIYVILLLLQINTSAQVDYLVNTKGDTVKGAIRLQMVGNIEQANVKGLKRESFQALNIREVFLKGVHYKPVQHAGTIKLMQIITDGYLSLLAFQPQGILNYDGRLLQKRDGSVLEVPSLGFKKQMAAFLQDNEKLSGEIKNGDLDRGDLSKIISSYNDYIIGKTKTQETLSKIAVTQKSKLELLNDFRMDIEKTELEAKQDLLDMVVEVEGKVKDNKPLPNYLTQGLSDRLANQAELKKKLEVLLEGLK
jgi:hypothetical protein